MDVPNLECSHEEVEGSLKEEQIRRGELGAADRSEVVEPHATSLVPTALTSSLAKDVALLISSVAPANPPMVAEVGFNGPSTWRRES
ncbi:MAG: hypothetical protein ACJAR2_000820 [Ilumatobacter sp.]